LLDRLVLGVRQHLLDEPLLPDEVLPLHADEPPDPVLEVCVQELPRVLHQLHHKVHVAGIRLERM
jgi:hypothetical protein